MKIPNWAKIIWWILLAGFFAYLLSQRYDSIISGAASATDIVIFLILIALLVIPLFQEVSIFGVSFKKEIDNLRRDVKEQFVDLRSEIQNTINIYPPSPSTDSELHDLEKSIKPIFEQTLKEHGISKAVPLQQQVDVPSDTQFLFSVRYAIENELKRIVKWLWAPPEERRYRTVLQIADILSKRGTITHTGVDIIREVFAICSAAIHGEDVSTNSVKFVKDTAPPLLAYLKSIPEQTNKPIWEPKETQS